MNTREHGAIRSGCASCQWPVGLGELLTADGKPRTKKRHERRAAYSFIGGSLIGAAVSLLLFLVNAEGDGALMLLVAPVLASTGIRMHLSGSKGTISPRPGETGETIREQR